MDKHCSKCGELKHLSEFNKQKIGKFGVRADCRKCQLAANMAYREANRESCRAYNREYRYANPERHAEQQRRWRAENSTEHNDRVRRSRARHAEKHAARRKLMHAIADGLIEKPDCCEDCGSSDRRIDGHHSDYSKPLLVDWLCSRCHGVKHRIAGR